MQITITEIERVDTKLVLFKFRTDIKVSVTVIEWHGIINGKITFKTPLETYSFDVYSIVSILGGPAPVSYTALDRFVEHEVYDARLQEIYDYLVRNIIQGCCCDTPSPGAGSFDEVATYADLPVTGLTDVLYYVADEGNFYVWDGAAYFSPDKVITSTASGTNTYTGTGSPTVLDWEENVIYKFRFTNANTGASTYNLDAVGAVAITDSTGAALVGGEIPADSIQFLVYDGTALRLMGGGGSSAATWGSITGTIESQLDLVNRVQNSEWVFGSTTGTDTYLVNLSPALTAYQAGQVFWLLFGNANTGASTINVNSLGAKTLVKNVSTALVSGDIPAGAILPVMYDGTNFQIDLKYAGIPTLQQVLSAGATMTQNNTVAGAGFRFTFDNFTRFTANTTERIALIADSGTDDGQVTINPAQIVYSTTNATTSSQLEQSPTGFTFDKPLNQHLGAALASAATVNIGAATGDTVHITGTTTITAFDTIGHGAIRYLIFDGSLTLTHNATSLILPTGANIQTAAGDTATFVSEGSGNWKCMDYQRASGKPLVQSGYITSPVKLNSSITPHTGTTTETVVFTDDVPVGTLIANDQLFFFVGCGATNNANNKTFRVYFNDTADLAGTPVLVATFTITSNAIQSGFGRYLVSKASISSWQTHSATTSISNPYSSTASAASTVTIDFSTLKYFVLTCQLANSADTMNVIAVNTQVLR